MEIDWTHSPRTDRENYDVIRKNEEAEEVKSLVPVDGRGFWQALATGHGSVGEGSLAGWGTVVDRAAVARLVEAVRRVRELGATWVGRVIPRLE